MNKQRRNCKLLRKGFIFKLGMYEIEWNYLFGAGRFVIYDNDDEAHGFNPKLSFIKNILTNGVKFP